MDADAPALTRSYNSVTRVTNEDTVEQQACCPPQVGRATWQIVQVNIAHGNDFAPLMRVLPLIAPCYCPLPPSAYRKQSAPHTPTTKMRGLVVALELAPAALSRTGVVTERVGPASGFHVLE